MSLPENPATAGISRDRRQRLVLGLAIVWSLLIVVACTLPASRIPKPERFGLALPFIDRWIHVALFAGWGLLWGLALPGRTRLVGLLLVGSTFGLFTEWLQGAFGLGRTADLVDFWADVLGVALGLGAVVAILPVVRGSTREKPRP